MDIKVSELIKAIGGKALALWDEEAPIKGISTDTRLISPGDAFFAFSGENFNGHDFIHAAVEKGARHIVLSEAARATPALSGKANFIQVSDTIRAYGDLAAHWRGRFKTPVVGITGTSGKTTVKELTAHLLSSKLKVLKNRGTENNLIGVPKTLLQIDASHRAVVIEMGTNRPGEIGRLSQIASPQIGVLTMIGHSHLEGLKNIEGVRREKMGILLGLERGGWLLVNGEDPLLSAAQSRDYRLLRCGFSKAGMTTWAEGVEFNERGASFYLNGEHPFQTRLLGRHNILNCLLALQCARTLGVDIPPLQRSLKEFQAVSGRLCLKEVEGIHFLDDTYNSNPGSFHAALETLKEIAVPGKKGVVCGDMLELGGHSERLHREMGAHLASLNPAFVVAAGKAVKFLMEEALRRGYDGQRISHVKDAADAGMLCRKLASPGDLVLVKGSRGMKMETVFDCFISCSTR